MKLMVIHPGMIEAPAVYKRVKSYAQEQGYRVDFHRCLDDEVMRYEPRAVHLAHSAGFVCSLLESVETVCLVAPSTNQAFWSSFFHKFTDDIIDSWHHREWRMFFYKNFSALGQLVFNYSYWSKMSTPYRTIRLNEDTFISKPTIVLYENDAWSEGYNWKDKDVTYLTGQHDELLYRPRATLQAVFDNF